MKRCSNRKAAICSTKMQPIRIRILFLKSLNSSWIVADKKELLKSMLARAWKWAAEESKSRNLRSALHSRLLLLPSQPEQSLRNSRLLPLSRRRRFCSRFQAILHSRTFASTSRLMKMKLFRESSLRRSSAESGAFNRFWAGSESAKYQTTQGIIFE